MLKEKPNMTVLARRLALFAVLVTAVALFFAGSAMASEGPAWKITSVYSQQSLKITAIETGGATDGSPITISDTVPAGFVVEELTGVDIYTNGESQQFPGGDSLRTKLTCSYSAPTATCTLPSGVVATGDQLYIQIKVSVEAGAPPNPVNQASVSGGGAEHGASVSNPVTTTTSPGFAPGSPYVDISTHQAGAHPNVTTGFEINRPTNYPKDIRFDLPAGLVGNFTAIPQCTTSRLVVNECPASSMVGMATVRVTVANLDFFVVKPTVPVFNIVPSPGEPAAFAFNVGIFPVRLDTSVRSDGDYGIRVNAGNVTESAGVNTTYLTLWGVPADHQGPGNIHILNENPYGSKAVGGPSANPRVPLLTNPTQCSNPLASGPSVDFWNNQGVFAVSEPSQMGILEGCNQVDFSPSIEARPTTNLADTPTGLHVDLHIPQNQDPDGLSEAALKGAVLNFPPGLVVNPSSANGLGACSPSQVGLTTPVGVTPAHFTAEAPNCPASSRIATVEVDSPLIDHPLPGSIYLATQNDNPFNSLLAIYLAVYDPQSGVVIKVPGLVKADPQTGQLSNTFEENPELPFEDLKVDFFNGPTASLRTPAICGTFTTTSDLTPRTTPEGADATPSDSFSISQGAGGGACASGEAGAPNKPAFTAGVVDPTAGIYSPFVLKLSRADGSQQIARLDATLPPGLSGRLAGIPYCSEAQIALAASRKNPGEGAAEQSSPSCPAASRVGTVDIGAGAGTTPFYAPGNAYLAGPYKGAPLSLVIVTPAVAGPFDLGTVVVRTALYVNPETTQIHAVSDPFPTILQGIPLDLRSIAVNISRSQFTLNPTSCEKMAVTGLATSIFGQGASLTNPFQVGDCAKLGFKPKLAISLKGATKRNKNPALRAVLTYPKGAYANIAKAQVTLPHSEFLDQSHIGTVCTRVQFAEGSGNGEKCPAASIYGHARAITPLLDQPVEGPVYLRSSSHNLPDLVAALGGQINIDLVGRIDTGKGGGIRNTFEMVPDAPVSKFVLEMQGGKKGLLVNSENICNNPQHATANFTGQNGKVSDTTPLIANSCGGKGKKKSKGHKKANAHR